MTDNASLDRAFARLQTLAETRGLPEVEPSNSDSAPALSVVGTAFIHLLDAETAVLQCPSDQKVLLMEISPDIYFETDHYIGLDAMLIHLDRISDEELSLRLHDAFMFKAPSRVKR